MKEIRLFSPTIARAAPQELADLVAASLMPMPYRGGLGGADRNRAFSFSDSDYIPPSPAQAPFLDLLEAAPNVGLELVRKLVNEAVAFRFNDQDTTDGFTLVFDDGPRFFPWIWTYSWSRDQAHDYSVASALMALEAWGHDRIQAGGKLSEIMTDILGPKGSCAAYLLVAVDLLLSHWPASRELMVPFVGCPELLATERGRSSHDRMNMGGSTLGSEPSGRVRLADLQAKPSRGVALERFLIGYLGDDDVSRAARSLLNDAVTRIGPYDAHADFGDPAFMGAYARNVLDANNWIEIGERREYRSPPAEADHLTRLAEDRSEHIRSSNIEAKIQLAVRDAERGSSDVAREAVEMASRDLPDGADTDVLKSRSTRLAATAMLVARDGDDELLETYHDWIREVVARTLSGEADRFHNSRAALSYNRQALATLAVIHLWRRRGAIVDRNALISAASRRDCCAVMAFSIALNVIAGIDARVLKSAVRVAFQSSRRRYHHWNEEGIAAQEYLREKAEADRLAIEAEISWLDGGCEPSWPSLPEEEAVLRRPSRIRVPSEDEVVARPRSEPNVSVHVDSQAAALWLGLMVGNALAPAWQLEIVDAYSSWSARMNGSGHAPDVEVDREPVEWNNVFYVLVANEMMDADDDRFDRLLTQIEGLPDRSFGNISEILIHAADVAYFNDVSRSAERPMKLRERLVARTLKFRYWNRDPRPGELSVDLDTGGVVAKILLNTHGIVGGTKSYLVAAVFERVDPLLDVLRPILRGGPTSFIALCTMNTLRVAPRARHLDFLLFAVETWLGRLPTDTGMWIELGIGRAISEWFNAAAAEDPLILQRDHLMRNRIDTAIGRLVKLGVPEAYEFEKLVASSEAN
jgi:hypothetical protein